MTGLSLTNYKNIDAVSYTFDTDIVCFIGKNGVGKSNLLDAIYHLCFGKGYFNPVAAQNIRFGEDFFLIEGVFDKNNSDKETIVCSLKKGHKKKLKRNGKTYDKIADHIGRFPLVIISPADRDLIVEGSSVRRKFMDGIMGQTDKEYLQDLLHFNRLVAQRNALLKYFAANHSFDQASLDIYDQQLAPLGHRIQEKRNQFITVFVPIFQKHYQNISSGDENVDIAYQTLLSEENYKDLLANALSKDRALQYTSVGPHKEDLDFLIHQYPIKKFGSQGQQKSLLIALKLAQFDFMKEKLGMAPIVLFDDVFDKLDQERVARIMQVIEREHFGQLFLSDTHRERTLSALKTTQLDYAIFDL